MNKLTELCGSIEKVIYKNNENGFSVFTLKVSSSESVIAKGFLTDIHQGETVSLQGLWAFHPKFGRQFDVKEYSTKAPASIEGIKKYLASGLIKGIGPKFAERVVETFGEKTLEVIENQPHRLMEVGGVGHKRVAMFIQAWQEQKEISKVMIFLRGKDVSTAFAVKIFKAYGNESLEKIQKNPYQLVEDVWGIGFKSADQIALKLGLEPTSLDRIKAGITYAITEATNNGHLYLEVSEAKEHVVELLEINKEESQEKIKQALHQLYEQDKIKLISHKEKHYLSLPKFYYSEKGIAKKIRFFLENPSKLDVNFDTIYNYIRTPDANGFELNEDQQRGILTCLQNNISVITGGPGTGKTTLVKKFLEVLETNHIKFRLAAPTGRAAKRMFEGTGRNAETLHRLLEFSPSTMGFLRNEQNALDLKFLIVDEASMLDVFLMHSVLRALPQKAHLVLLGDVDQLPSVGAGNVLNDIIASQTIPVIRLTQIFRQAQDSLIIVNAHRVNHGEFPTSALPGSKKDFVFLKQEEPEEIFPLLRRIYLSTLQQRNIHPDNAVVLVPMNRGTVGTQRLNQELQMILNPSSNEEKEITRFGQVYKINDRVMQIRNNYDKFVFNGDIGKISDIDKVEQKMVVTFGERALEYDFTEINELVLAYAISIHKSQGSEFDAVIIPIFMQHFILLQRNLIYTAITRAKKYCILLGQTKAIAMGIKNNKGVVRNTFLKEFLTTDLEAR
ncbi:ATP-dependent RecD-like DNA helicase [Candidatus Babeliales bacterium]|nr:ATP-dependent RecD-like DNA helicase [Candidatus Babeliales bacterium]